MKSGNAEHRVRLHDDRAALGDVVHQRRRPGPAAPARRRSCRRRFRCGSGRSSSGHVALVGDHVADAAAARRQREERMELALAVLPGRLGEDRQRVVRGVIRLRLFGALVDVRPAGDVLVADLQPTASATSSANTRTPARPGESPDGEPRRIDRDVVVRVAVAGRPADAGTSHHPDEVAVVRASSSLVLFFFFVLVLVAADADAQQVNRPAGCRPNRGPRPARRWRPRPRCSRRRRRPSSRWSESPRRSGRRRLPSSRGPGTRSRPRDDTRGSSSRTADRSGRRR